MSDAALSATATPPQPLPQQPDPTPAAAAAAAAEGEAAVVDAPLPLPAVVITGLPEQGVTAHDVRQYMTYCGLVQDVVLEPASAAALVYFRDAGSAVFATRLSGGVLKGKVVRLRRATVEEAKLRALSPAVMEPVADPPPTAAAPALRGGYTPQTGGGVSMRTRLFRQAAQTAQTHPAQLWSRARDGVTRLALGTASLELRAAHAMADAVDPRERTPVYGNGPTRQQYNYTATQPQWGERPAWLRGP